LARHEHASFRVKAHFRKWRQKKSGELRPFCAAVRPWAFSGLGKQAENAPLSRERKRTGGSRLKSWLPFLNTYRTMCVAPEPHFRRVLEEVLAMRFGMSRQQVSPQQGL
jgi:hypothetical protein